MIELKLKRMSLEYRQSIKWDNNFPEQHKASWESELRGLTTKESIFGNRIVNLLSFREQNWLYDIYLYSLHLLPIAMDMLIRIQLHERPNTTAWLTSQQMPTWLKNTKRLCEKNI